MTTNLAKQFEARWKSSDPAPDVFEFLDQHRDSGVDELLAVLLVDQSHRWKTDHPFKVEDYLDRLPDLNSEPDYKLQLVVGEFQTRSDGDTFPDIDEFTSRFPDIGDALKSKLTEITSGNDRIRTTTTKSYITDRTIGDQQVGRYRLVRVLGEGGFGRVYLGFDEELQRRVAIKVPTPERFEKPEDAEAYLTEARTVASLNHPNIVPVYDTGRTADGSIYVVSKFIEGCTLGDRIKQDRPSHDNAAQLLATVAQALHHAHERRLIHRDVKPGNILLEESTGTPYVADFGLAISEEDYLKDNRIAGTPAYMSPEQVRGEGHRLDGRSDIFSLGVVLYQLLTGRRPFRGETRNVLLHQVASLDPPHPRELNESIPDELERICLKALSKRASDRYATAAEFADDLLHWNDQPEQEAKDLQIIPKGLRSFDADDADFFLDLLPGPRNRTGLPESIQLWKTRIEETDPDKTFSIGLIYGPSGCGKSSLVKAGLLPRLSKDVIAVYVEATPGETETRTLHALRKQFPELPDDLGLVETFNLLRRSEGRKVVIILDQFEQWLHVHRAEQETKLVAALRQCDGSRLQAVVMVRDDFSMAAARFMRELETRIIEGHNFATLDLFDVDHARKVLIKFGQAFGKLPDQTSKFTNEEQEFVTSVASGLADDGKVVSVRLSLFAEMVKGKFWVPTTLHEVGGTQGIGVNFLEETFGSRDSNPEHLLHQQAARDVLKALLPEVGSDIKGHLRSHAELLDASGYDNRPSEFDDLLRMLDGELRLITPTDSEGFQSDSVSDHTAKFYQLAHDYLVPSLRDWLTRKQKETRSGRAELKLEELSALWNVKPENRRLPSLLEWASIRTLTDKKRWTQPQRKMMGKAGGLTVLHTGLAGLVIMLVVLAGLFIAGRVEAQQNANYAKALVESLSAANTADVEGLIGEIGEYQQWTTPLLQDIVAHEDSSPKEKLHASLALVKDDPSQVDFLFQQLLSAKTDEVPVIVTFLKPHRGQLGKQLWKAIEDGSNSERIRAAVAQAEFDSQNEHWKQVSEDVANALVSVPSSDSDEWIEMLRPVRSVLVDPLERRFKDRSSIRIAERPIVAAALADYLGDEPQLVKEFILLADNDREFQPLLLALRNHEQIVAGELRSLLSQSPPENISPHERNNFWKMQANAAVCLLELGETNSVWPLFQQSPNPSLRSFIIDRIAPLGANHEPIAAQIMNESDPATRYALVLALGQFDVGKMSSQQRKKLFEQLETLYRRDPEPGVHSAAGWALRNRQKNLDLSDLDAEFIKDAPRRDRNWFVNSQGQTFAVAQGLLEFSEAEETKEAEPSKVKTISHRFAMATHEVTVAQFQKFRSDHKHNSRYAQEPDSPVNMLRWDDAMAYCNWLSQQEGIPKEEWCYPNPRGFDLPIALQGRDDVPADYLERTGYRLPTEQEWEFICRAGTTSAYSYGEPVELLDRYAWYLNNSDSHLWPVGMKLPNALGMFDTHGNVKEWCRRFVLGGSVEDPPELLRMNAEGMSGSAGSFGLRPARTMPR